MSLRTTVIDSTLATGVKLIGGLVAIKLLALLLGPEGLGRIGNVFSVVALVNALASCGIALGVTRYVGQYHLLPDVLKKFLGAANALTLLSSISLSVFGVLFAEELSVWLFREARFAQAIRIASCLIVPIGFASLGVAVVNGFGATRLLVWLQVSAAILGSIGLVLAVVGWGDRGAVVGLFWVVASPVLVFPFLLRRYRLSNIFTIRPELYSDVTKKLLHYAIAMLVTVVTHNLVQIIFREWIVADHGLKSVGYWQGMLRISDAYLQVFNVFLVAYLLPRLSQEQDKVKVVGLISGVYRFLIPVLFVVFFLVYLSRDLIVELLLSREFSGVTDLFIIQLFADFFRVLSYVPGYIVLARGHIPLLILADPIQAALLLGCASFVISDYGPQGACLAYGLAYFIYFLFSVIGLAMYGNRA